MAFAEGHGVVAQLLSSLVARSPEPEIATARTETVPEHDVTAVQQSGPDGLDDMLSFEAEEEPEELFDTSVSDTVSGTFVAI